MAGAYQGPTPRAFSTRTFQGVGLVGSRWRVRLRNGLARLHFLSCEIARCCSDRPPSGYHHTLEKQRLGRALSCVLCLQSLDLGGGRGWWKDWGLSVQTWRDCSLTSQGALARSLGVALFPPPSGRGGGQYWHARARTCTRTHTHLWRECHVGWRGSLSEPPLSPTFPSCSLTV